MSDTAPVRVVVVDDAEEMRELLTLTLAREPDFTVIAEAADGAAGVQAVAETVPDLVLLDVSMPVMDGLEALRVIRSQSPAPAVVMFSAFGDATEVAGQAMRLGAHGYIRKGEALSALPEQLRVLLGTARTQGGGPDDVSW